MDMLDRGKIYLIIMMIIIGGCFYPVVGPLASLGITSSVGLISISLLTIAEVIKDKKNE